MLFPWSSSSLLSLAVSMLHCQQLLNPFEAIFFVWHEVKKCWTKNVVGVAECQVYIVEKGQQISVELFQMVLFCFSNDTNRILMI